MTSPRVAFVHHSLRRGGGSERVLFEVIQRMDRSRLAPVVVCMYEPGEFGLQLRESGVDTVTGVMRGPWDLFGVRRLARVLTAKRCSAVCVTDGFMNMVVAFFAARWSGIGPTLLSFHSYDSVLRRHVPLARRLLLNLADRLFLKRFERYVALSEGHRDYLVNVKGLIRSKVSVISNGVEVPKALERPLTDDLGFPDGAPLIATIGSLRTWKGQDIFLQAAARVLVRRPSANFALAGDGPERARLESLAQSLGCASQVRFLGKIDDPSSLLVRADLVVLSSWHEAFPLSLMEAMAVATPVIATDVGSVSELIEDGVNGVVVPPGDPGSLARAIGDLLDDGALRARLGTAGQQTIESEYSAESMARGYEDLLVSMIVDVG